MIVIHTCTSMYAKVAVGLDNIVMAGNRIKYVCAVQFGLQVDTHLIWCHPTLQMVCHLQVSAHPNTRRRYSLSMEMACTIII